MTAVRRVAFVCVVVGVSIACDGTHPVDERFASLYRGGQRSWVLESSLPAEPQERPRMLIYEVTEYPEGDPPTLEQVRVSQELVTRCFDAALRNGWFQFKNAIDQGYRLLFGDKRHYVKPAYVFDDDVLDCDKPEFLMYYDTPGGKALAGLMFYAEAPKARGTQVGGPLTVWHYHVWAPTQCLQGEMLLVGTADEQGRCKKGVAMHRSPEMLHIWFIDRPNGPFTTSMYLPDEEVALLTEKRAAPTLPVEAFADATP